MRELYEDVKDMMKGHTPQVAEEWTRSSGSTKSPQYTARQGERPYHFEDYPNGREHPSVVEQFWSFIEANYKACQEPTNLFWRRMCARYEALRGQTKPTPCVASLAGRVTTEFKDIVIAELEKLPMADRLKHAMELRVAVDDLISGYMHVDMEDAADISERAS